MEVVHELLVLLVSLPKCGDQSSRMKLTATQRSILGEGRIVHGTLASRLHFLQTSGRSNLKVLWSVMGPSATKILGRPWLRIQRRSFLQNYGECAVNRCQEGIHI